MKVSKEIIPPFSFLRQNPVKGYGEFNGYVSLPIGHCWYGKNYAKLQEVDVHYGLTYSEEEDGRWVIGFDTAHASDDPKDWNREKVRKEANKLLDQAESAERRKREQEKERRIELECHEKREEGRHWYQPYPEAVPLDLWELFRALTYELYGKINHELLMKTVTHHSKRSDKLDAYRIYPERGDGILTAGSSFKLIVGIRYGMSVDDYDSPFVTNETAALFNLDPLNRDN